METVVADILGVNELRNRNGEKGVKVYPNPATNYIKIAESGIRIRNKQRQICFDIKKY